MKHLYKKIYLTIIASLIALVIIAGIFWKLFSDSSRFKEPLNIAREIALALLPPADQPVDLQRKKLEELKNRLKLDLALYSQDGKLIATTDKGLPGPDMSPRRRKRSLQHRGKAWLLKLPDQRWLTLRMPKSHGFGPYGFVMFLGAIALAIALAVYPAVRGLTRRLERLQTGVETLGSGDLSARVSVEGRDEIAQVAKSFNIAAERIEALMKAHKMFLANASHELRTPLSRLRVAVELLKDKADPKHKANLETDIAELDSMIEEILLASRLNSLDELDKIEEVDLLALIAEETSRYPEFDLDGEPVIVSGDSRLLRRLVRNLLENAKRYGQPPVKVLLEKGQHLAVFQVADGGKDISSEDFEKIFEPFYRPEGAVGTAGTGLGLSLVRQIARRHGGDAIVQHNNQGTTCFKVTLPFIAS